MAAVAINHKPTGALALVTRGRLEKPPRILLYAREKIGKTGFAAGAPSPLFLCSEMGTEEYDVARIPASSWLQTISTVDSLINDSHDYKTLVLDTIDHLEAVLHRHIIASDDKGRTSMVTVHGGFGKAFKMATEETKKLAVKLDTLTEKRRMTIVLLAHAHVEKFNDPESDGWDQYRLKMHKETAGFWREWVDAVLFANLDIATKKNDDDKTKAIGTGDRLIYTIPPRSAAYEAGNRYALPATLPLRWSALDAAIKASGALRSELEGLLVKLPSDVAVKIGELAREAKDFDSLKSVVEKTRARVAGLSETTTTQNVTSQEKSK
jgi:hypothetical protein